jgi:hypothetical protein
MLARKLLLTLGLMVVGTGTALADAHTVSYVKRSGALGDTVTVGGQDYVLVRIPVKTFTGVLYGITIPCPVVGPGFGGCNVSTVHVGANDPFTQNITIDGFPANVSVQDFRHYSLDGQIGTDSTFQVFSGASGSLTIKLGTTLVLFSEQFIRQFTPGNIYETDVDVGDATNIRPFAQFGNYRDPLPEVSSVNIIIDYIRILPL